VSGYFARPAGGAYGASRKSLRTGRFPEDRAAGGRSREDQRAGAANEIVEVFDPCRGSSVAGRAIFVSSFDPPQKGGCMEETGLYPQQSRAVRAKTPAPLEAPAASPDSAGAQVRKPAPARSGRSFFFCAAAGWLSFGMARKVRALPTEPDQAASAKRTAFRGRAATNVFGKGQTVAFGSR